MSTTDQTDQMAANELIVHMCQMPGMGDYLVSKGASAGDLAAIQALFEDTTLVFFSIDKVVKRQIRKTKKASDYIPGDDKVAVIK